MLHILMFIRILTVYPLLTYFIRVQNFSGKFQKPRISLIKFFNWACLWLVYETDSSFHEYWMAWLYKSLPCQPCYCRCWMFLRHVLWQGKNLEFYQSLVKLLRLVILFATLEVFVQWFICFSCHVESRWVVKNILFANMVFRCYHKRKKMVVAGVMFQSGAGFCIQPWLWLV